VTPGPDEAAKASIKKLVDGASKFHTAWVCRKVLLEAHLSDSNLFVNSDTIHDNSPKIFTIMHLALVVISERKKAEQRFDQQTDLGGVMQRGEFGPFDRTPFLLHIT
jgi:hypothetical protein